MSDRYRPVDALAVWMWGRRVGAVAPHPERGFYAFRYDPEWVADGVELAPFTMPLAEGRTYVFDELAPETFHRLPAMLADSLPDRFGNALIDAWMAERGLTNEDFGPLDRLAYVGSRGMGGLEYRPPIDVPDTDQPTAISLADLVVAARHAVAGDVLPGIEARELVTQLVEVGSSAGGARPKALVAFHPHTYQIRSAHDPDLPDGFEQWILKLDGIGDTSADGHTTGLGSGAAYGRIEYAYHRMAVEAGITMSECRLLAEGPRHHFLTRRFDRGPGDSRNHLISLCALGHLDFNLPRAHSYDQYLDAVERLGLGLDARAEAYRRMVFNVMAMNRDDHTKNLAFLRREGRDWELAPAFDVTFAHNPAGAWTSQHQMAVNGKHDGITIEDLYAVGDRHDVPAFRRIVSDVRAAVDRWPDHAAAAEVPEEDTHRITEAIDTVSLA